MGDRAMSQSVNPSIGQSVDPLWYKDAVIYQVHVRSVLDTTGDGVGDFTRPESSKLDYIQSLGVNGHLDAALLPVAAA